MDVQALRMLYDYHFFTNRRIWEYCIVPLPQELFTQPIPYSVGSLHNHFVHLMSVDNAWFCGLRGVEAIWLNAEDFANREQIRARWDTIEADMRAYLATLRDDMLSSKPFAEDQGEVEDKDLTLWQVLMQVLNHGTDHRAQVLRILHDFGVETFPQDFVFYLYEQKPNQS
jgi:uncharacterized damage-inducible protein DinB